MRRSCRSVMVGRVAIGANAKVSIQSMTNTPTEDIDGTVGQIGLLEQAGCDIVRVSVYNQECAAALCRIKQRTKIPIVADIHFDYRLAIAALENGADKLRVNPGNIQKPEQISAMVDCAKMHHVPIRIGVNAGSISKDMRERYGVTPQALVQSAMEHVSLLEQRHFRDIVISVKASNVPMMIESYRLLAKETDYPLHLGVTEAGDAMQGAIKSAIGIGALLLEGIGDTIRVSLTGDPVQEVAAAQHILRSVGMYHRGIEIISCPTCGRTRVDIQGMVEQIRKRCSDVSIPLKVAVMGCVVNGPGEASNADIGIAGGDGKGILFENGQVVASFEEDQLVAELIRRIHARQEGRD